MVNTPPAHLTVKAQVYITGIGGVGLAANRTAVTSVTVI
jgi:hypothetical protein